MVKSRIQLLSGILLFALACSPGTNTPGIQNAPTSEVDIEACRNTSLDFKVVNADNVRSLINCLNGKKKVLQPFKDFFDSASTSDLNIFFNSLNKHLPWGSQRQLQLLELLKLSKTQGHLPVFFKNMQVLGEAKFIHHFINNGIAVLEKNSPTSPDEDLKGFNRFMIKNFDSGLHLQMLRMLGLFDSNRSRVAAYLLSASQTVSETTGLNSDQVTDHLAGMLLKMMGDQSLHSLSSLVSDPNILKTFNNTSSADRDGFFQIFKYFSSHSENNYESLRRAQVLIKATDRPLSCFNSKNNKTWRAESILQFVVDQIKDKTKEEIDDFLLKTTPLLFASTGKVCDIPPEIIANYSVVTDLSSNGYSQYYGRFWSVLSSTARTDVLVTSLQSPYYITAAPLIWEMSNRKAFRALIDVVGDDISGSNVEALSRFLTQAAIENLSGDTLSQWIAQNFNTSALKPAGEELQKVLAGFAPNARNLENLIFYIEANSQFEKSAGLLRKVISEIDFKNSPEKNIFALGKRVLSDDYRSNLKDLIKSLVLTWMDNRGGLGNLFKTVGQIADLKTEKPISDFFKDVLNDQAYFDELSPVLVRLARNPHFPAALDLAARLSGTGDLEKVTIFFVDLMRGTQKGTELPNGPVATYPQYSDVPVLAEPYTKLQDPPKISYEPCLNLKGDIFSPSGEPLLAALKCTNSLGNNPELESLGESLKKQNLLPQAAFFMNAFINQSPQASSVMEQLEALLKQGALAAVLKLYVQMGDPKHQIFSYLDPLSVKIFSHKDSDTLLSSVSWLFSNKELNLNLSTLAEVSFNQPQAIYQAHNNYRLKVKDPSGIKQQIAQWYPNDPPEAIEKMYQAAKENFETHNDVWTYDEGSYPLTSYQDYRNELLAALSDLLRTTDLEEMVAVLQEFAKDNSALELVKYLSEKQMVVQNYNLKDELKIHIQTGLDALENLVLNANFGYATTNNIGTSFQLAVQKSNDYITTINDLHGQVKFGRDVANIFGPKRKLHLFKNILSNFPVLFDLAETGKLRVLQKVYQALYRATPDGDKENQDPDVNHMGLTNRFNRLGLFKNLTMAMAQTKEQGKTDLIGKSTIGFLLKIKAEDLPFLKKALQIIVAQAKEGKTNAFDQTLSLFWKLQGDSQSYEKFKTHLFHVVVAQDMVLESWSPIFKVLPSFMEMKVVPTALVNKIFDTVVDRDGLFIPSANLLSSDFYKVSKLKAFLSSLMARPEAPQLLKMAAGLYEADSVFFDSFSAAFKGYWNDPYVVSLNPGSVIKQSLQIMSASTDQGIWTGLSHLFADPQVRSTVITLGMALGKDGQFKGFNTFLARKAAQGDIEYALHFLFDHFKKQSLKFN